MNEDKWIRQKAEQEDGTSVAAGRPTTLAPAERAAQGIALDLPEYPIALHNEVAALRAKLAATEELLRVNCESAGTMAQNVNELEAKLAQAEAERDEARGFLITLRQQTHAKPRNDWSTAGDDALVVGHQIHRYREALRLARHYVLNWATADEEGWIEKKMATLRLVDKALASDHSQPAPKGEHDAEG